VAVEPSIVEVRHPRVLLSSVAFSFKRDDHDISFVGATSNKRRSEVRGYGGVVHASLGADDIIGSVRWEGQHSNVGWYQISFAQSAGLGAVNSVSGTTNYIAYPFSPLYVVYTSSTRKLSVASNTLMPLCVSSDIVDEHTDANQLVPILTKVIERAVRIVDKLCSDVDPKAVLDIIRHAAEVAGYGTAHYTSTCSTTLASNNVYTQVINGL
jgi:hypothetical protein